jgi:hypothetical protein
VEWIDHHTTTSIAKEPVCLTAFGTIMKGELGVLYEEKSKRGFYVGIKLAGAPKLVAAPRRALGNMVSTSHA